MTRQMDPSIARCPQRERLSSGRRVVEARIGIKIAAPTEVGIVELNRVFEDLHASATVPSHEQFA